MAGCFLLLSCGVPKGRLRISGTYESFKEGADFLIVSTDGGLNHLDTLHIVGGEFDKMYDLTGDATYHIVYPDNSDLMLWAHSGDHIQIKESGDGLWKVKVEGNEENELYMQFRLQNVPTDSISLRQSAAQFIRQNPASSVSQYLLCQYFILSGSVPPDSVQQLYDVIQKALPQDAKVANLGGQIQQKYTLQKGQMMPSFDIVTSDSIHRNLSYYKGKNLVIYFWAGWQSSVAYLHHSMTKLKQDLASPEGSAAPLKIELLGYSLDVDSATLRVNLNDEAKEIPTFCDLQGFNSPLAYKLGVRTLPLIVCVGPDGRIRCVCKDAKDAKAVLEK